jgi:HEAT repeats
MVDQLTPPSPDDTLHELRQLLHTAIYDTGSFSNEEGYWPHTIYHVDLALDELRRRLAGRPLADDELAAVRAAVAAPDAPPETAARLLAALRQWTRPLIETLLTDPLPELRVVALHAGPHPPERWLPALDDPHPLVRRATVALLAGRIRDDAVPDALALVRNALGDPDEAVRRAAMEAAQRYYSGERDDLVAAVAEHDPDPAIRQIALHVLVAASHRHDRRLTPEVHDVLLRALDSPDPARRASGACALRRYGGAEIGHALCARLLVEDDSQVLKCLLEYRGYRVYQPQVIPRLTELLARVTEPPLRVSIARTLAQFDGAAVTLLAPLLDERATRPTAVSSLRWLGNVRGLAPLAGLMAQIGDHRSEYQTRREISEAVREIVRRARWRQPGPPAAETLEALRTQIDALRPPAVRFRGRDVPALPVRETPFATWLLLADGTLLRRSPRAQGPLRAERDPLSRFVALAYGAYRHPELEALVPLPAQEATSLCICDGRGIILRNWRGVEEHPCSHCKGLGWLPHGPAVIS